MSDLISKSALIEQIKNIYCKDCNNYNFVKCRACEYDDAMREIYDAPTIEPYGTWIPCDDYTSVKEGKYIVTTAKGTVYCTKGNKYGFGRDRNTHIIAYMPLPEPYREEKKDE